MNAKNQAHADAAPVLLWFRYDLRLGDHDGVAEALASGGDILPVYILDEKAGTRPLGAASRWWLDRSLRALDKALRHKGSRLIVRQGASHPALHKLIQETGARTVICSRSFDPAMEDADDALEKALKPEGVTLSRHNTTLMAPPGLIRTGDGGFFKVFTPYFKALLASGLGDAHDMPGAPKGHWPAPRDWPDSVALDDLKLGGTRTASGKDWAAGFDRFTPGEAGALAALEDFIDTHLAHYATERDRPDKDATSHLSPHLRFGEISPRRILSALDAAKTSHNAPSVEKFRSELAWREFSYGLLTQQPRLDKINFRRDFDGFPWRDDDKGFRAWCRGETGYPLVDAGMRELWRTGYMHNRVRMVCASFLIKHLLIDWRRGERWFWDCLVDADPANNTASWQWVAGCGADAAPYFRIFNPMTQAEKFDPQGRYRKLYNVPDTQNIHSKKGGDLFDMADETHGYPQPIVDHALARERALEAYKQRQA